MAEPGTMSDAELLADAIARRLQRRVLTGAFRVENDYMPILRRHIRTVIEQSAYTLAAARPAGDQVTISAALLKQLIIAATIVSEKWDGWDPVIADAEYALRSAAAPERKEGK